MKAIDLRSIKLNHLIKHEKEYDFPLFLTLLRKQLGVTRTVCEEETSISSTRMHYLESGKFKMFPEWECSVLAEYFDVPPALLRRKAQQFLKEKLNHEQKQEYVSESLPMAEDVCLIPEEEEVIHA